MKYSVYYTSLALFVSLAFLSSLCAEDAIIKEAQDAFLKKLDIRAGYSNQHSIHLGIRDYAKDGENEQVYEFWNPKLQIRLKKQLPLSAADRLNGEKQILWAGNAIVVVDAYRLSLSSETSHPSERHYKRWETPPLDILCFSLIKTLEGWVLNKAKIGDSEVREPTCEALIQLSVEEPIIPRSSISESEVKTVFNELIHSQTSEEIVIVERTLAEWPNFINEDKYHEFKSPSLEIAMLPLTAAQALNGDVITSVRINCAAHRYPKILKSKTPHTPAIVPQEISMWNGEERGLKWNEGPSPHNKGDCDFVGTRTNGNWTFTISAFLLNPVWINKVILLPKSKAVKPEDDLARTATSTQRPHSGIGAGLAIKGNVVEIVSLIAGGPAEKTGQLKIGDRIVAISTDDPPVIWGKIDIAESDNQSFRDSQLMDVVKEIRGMAGKPVHLRIQPVGTSDSTQLKEVRIIREEITQK